MNYLCSAQDVRLSWTPSTGATEYYVNFIPPAGVACPAGWGTTRNNKTGTYCYKGGVNGVAGITTTSITVPITPGTTYNAWVNAANSAGVSAAADGGWAGAGTGTFTCGTKQPTPTMPNRVPFGYLDSATCTDVKGWAYDHDDQNTAVTVSLYEGGTLLGSFKADRARPDVNRVMKITGNHGFAIPLPAALLDGKAHTISVYANDLAGGLHAQLQQSPRTITCSSAVTPIQTMLASAASSMTAPFDIVTNLLSDTFLALGLY